MTGVFYEVACPNCEAPIGETCMRSPVNGTSKPLTLPHALRRRLAIAEHPLDLVDAQKSGRRERQPSHNGARL